MTMYLPNHFEPSSPEKAIELAERYPFATLIAVHDGSPLINHLPLLIQKHPTTGKTLLLGHMATRNPQAALLPDNGEVTVVFHGPHTYITPKWYAENDVPTWNYAVAHFSGHIRWVRDYSSILKLLKKLSSKVEGNGPESWQFFLPDDLKGEAALTEAIVGFEIEVEKIQAKFKLSQNRSADDRQGVLRGLESRTDEMSHLVLEMMRSQ